MPVTIEELCPVEFHPANSMSDPDDVFKKNDEKTERNVREPPPVPMKSDMARQVAQLIALSRDLTVETMPNYEEYFDTKL